MPVPDADSQTAPERSRSASALAVGLWAVAMAVILIHVWLKPYSNTLYKVFEAGGQRWLATENLYPKVDEYIYSPVAAAFFAPLALLPDRVSGIIWRLLSLGVYAGAFGAWLRNTARGNRAAVAWILLLPLSVGDLFNGQANPLVIGLLMLAVLACRREQWMIAALCTSVAAYFKVYPLAIGLLLAVVYPRRFAWRLAVAIVGIFALSLVLQRPGYVLQQYVNWGHTLGLDPRRTLNYFGTYRDFWLVLRVLHVPISLNGWACLQAVSGGAAAAYLFVLKRRGVPAEALDFILLLTGTCWMLLFGPATESSTYVILAPPLVIAGLRWSGEGRRGCVAGAAICYALLIASQMITSWAHQHQNAYTHLVQPAGTMVLTAAVIACGLAQLPQVAQRAKAELAGKRALR